MAHITSTNVPTLLPVAGAFAVPFTAYFLSITWRITLERVSTNTHLGTTPSTSSKQTDRKDSSLKDKVAEPEFSRLERLYRSQSNFIENVPLALILLVIAELNGGDRKILSWHMGVLLLSRIAHADYGLMVRGKHYGCGVGRPIGFLGTSGVLAGLSGYVLWLVRGYWGF